MKIVTPVSQFFEVKEFGLDLCSVSTSLEARPDLGLEVSLWPIPISHIHFSQPSLDAHLPWTESDREEILTAIDGVSDTLTTVSFHLSRDYVSQRQNEFGQYLPAGDRLTESTMMDQCEKNVSWLRGVFSGQILFENNNYFPTGAYRTATNPEIIGRLVASFADGLLFDFAHAQISAHNLGVAIDEYLESLLQLPILQIHLSRPRVVDRELMRDDHDLPGEEEVRELDRLIGRERIGQTPITIEHYKDLPGVKHLISSLVSFFG